MFKSGDKVKCINNRNAIGYLKLGRTYTVERLRDPGSPLADVYLKGINPSWMPERFTLVKSAPPKRKPGKKSHVNIGAKDLAIRNLELAEDLYLRAHGWKPARNGDYRPPKGYSSPSIYQGGTFARRHAVNSQFKRSNP